MMFARLFRHPLALLLIFAIAARLSVLALFPSVFDFATSGVIHGSDAYDKYARHLNETGVYGLEAGVPDAAIPPLYGVALSLVYRFFGRGYWQVGLFHIALDALSILLLYDIARRLLHHTPYGRTIALLAGLMMAAYPYLIFQNLTLIDTPLFITLLHAFVWLMILLRERPRADWATWLVAVVGGLVLGLATLTRPIIPVLALFVAGWFLMRLSWWQTVARLSPVALVSAAVLLPWIWRNYQVFDAFIPMTTTSGANFWQGNSEYTIPVFQAGYDVQWTAPQGIPSTFRDREADAQRFALGLQYWRDNPDKLPLLFWTKFWVHWSIDIAPRYNPQQGEQFQLGADGALQIVRGDQSIVGVNEANTAYDEPLFDVVGRWVHRFYFGFLLLAALAGIWWSRRQWREVALLWFVQLSMTFIYVLFHPSTRYRAPSDPLLFIFSAYAVVSLWLWWRRRGASADKEGVMP